jgi:Tubulin-tyrosine ligase family
MACIEYSVRSPWEWVLAKVESDIPMKHCKDRTAMVSGFLQPTPNRMRRAAKKRIQPCTVRFDLIDKKGKLLEAYHGISSALDGLEDKDELVRTFQRCRADHLGFTPPSTLIRWDATLSECQNMVRDWPVLPENKESKVAVLKEPIGSQGEGIYFVSTVDDLYEILEKHRNRAIMEGQGFLDSIMEQKGRIPSWVLQAEVHPPLLIRNNRKFHIRSYVVAIECPEENHLVNLYLYNRHEVRIAGMAVTDVDATNRDRRAHITNGANGNTTARVLMNTVDELAEHQHALEYFSAKVLNHLLPDICRRVEVTRSEHPPEIHKHMLAGLDIMMTHDLKFVLLEVNVNPAAPPEINSPPDFTKHLVGFMTDMKNLVLGYDAPNFTIMEDIILRGSSKAS